MGDDLTQRGPGAAWYAAALALVTVVTWSLVGLDGPASRHLVGIVNTALWAGLSVRLAVRARAAPAEEAPGWWWWAASAVVVTVQDSLITLDVGGPSRPGEVRTFVLALSWAATILGVVGFARWPWRRGARGRRLLHALGAVLFVGSLYLVLWIVAVWLDDLRGVDIAPSLLVRLFSRMAVLGGAGLVYILESPRRARGPLGWIVAGILGGGFVAGVLNLLWASGDLYRGPAFAFLVTMPLAVSGAAEHRGRVESAPADPGEGPQRAWDALMYAPYVTAGLGLALGLWCGWLQVGGPALGFVVLTSVLVARQFVLLGEVRASERAHTESRVRAATEAAQRRMDARLREAQRLESVGRVAGGVAHDFSNLMSVVLSSSEALEAERAMGRPADPELIETIRLAGERAVALTRQLLTFARKQAVSPEPVDLGAAVRRSEFLLRRVLGAGVKLAVDVDPETWQVLCDPSQLEQVLLNLAVNARDAMPAGGTLHVSTQNVVVRERDSIEFDERPGAWACLVVRDEGVGMTPGVKAHLFEPFFTTKPPGRGSGLGLATVHGIVSQSGGHIRVETTPGLGTTFEVRFPRLVTEAPAVPRAASPTAG